MPFKSSKSPFARIWGRNIAPPSPTETLYGGVNSRTGPLHKTNPNHLVHIEWFGFVISPHCLAVQTFLDEGVLKHLFEIDEIHVPAADSYL